MSQFFWYLGATQVDTTAKRQEKSCNRWFLCYNIIMRWSRVSYYLSLEGSQFRFISGFFFYGSPPLIYFLSFFFMTTQNQFRIGKWFMNHDLFSLSSKFFNVKGRSCIMETKAVRNKIPSANHRTIVFQR